MLCIKHDFGHFRKQLCNLFGIGEGEFFVMFHRSSKDDLNDLWTSFKAGLWFGPRAVMMKK